MLLYVLQQQQAAAATAAAIAAKPGCKSIIDLSGTSASSPKSLSGKSATNNEIAMNVTLTSGKKIVLTGNGFAQFGSGNTAFYSATACTDGNFADAGGTFSRNRISTSRVEFTITTSGTYTFYYDGSSSSNEAAWIE